ncbi:MAG: alginate export family protein [Flavobacteriales bacterium]|nr:alginate export family protein [Flavobacteriales bacterium]
MKANTTNTKRHLTKHLTVLFLLLFSVDSLAQFTMSGEIRPRGEYRHGYKTIASPNHDPAAFVDQRSRLNMSFLSAEYKVKFSLQDVRVWGSQPQLVSSDGLTSLHEGWGEVFLKPNYSLKVGRQEIIYDDHRIFGSVDWTQQARSHDAAILKFKNNNYNLHFGAAYNQDKAGLSGQLASNGTYKTFQYAWYNHEASNFKLSALILNNGKQVFLTDSQGNITGGRNNYSQTMGGRLSFNTSDALIHIAGYIQRGEEADVVDTEIQAYNFKIDGTLPLSDNFKATAGLEMLSGNSELTTNDKNHAFNPFYGTNHKFNGHMDYFFVGNHINSVGLNDYFLTGVYKKNAYTFVASLHYFHSNASVKDDAEFARTGRTTEADKHLGTELDMSLAYSVSKDVSIKAGYSFLEPTETLGYLKGGDINERNEWGWLMIVFKPNFIKG